MEKVKVNLLVKGNIIVIGDAQCDTTKANFEAFGNNPIPDKYDLNEAAVIEGDLVVKGDIVLSNGVISTTGDIITLAKESVPQGEVPQSCDPHFLKGDENQPDDNGWHVANHGCKSGEDMRVTCYCPFFEKTPDGRVVVKAGLQTSGNVVALYND